VVERREYLLTTRASFYNDAVNDRGWVIASDPSGRPYALTGEGVRVDSVFHAQRLWAVATSSVLHRGSGYERDWSLADRIEVDALVVDRGLRWAGSV